MKVFIEGWKLSYVVITPLIDQKEPVLLLLHRAKTKKRREDTNLARKLPESPLFSEDIFYLRQSKHNPRKSPVLLKDKKK